MTLRAYMDERGHFLQLRKNENVFGGGRIDFKRDRCDLTVDAFNAALLEAQGTKAEVEVEKPKARKKAEPSLSLRLRLRLRLRPMLSVSLMRQRRSRSAVCVWPSLSPRRSRRSMPISRGRLRPVEEKPKRRTRKRRVVEE